MRDINIRTPLSKAKRMGFMKAGNAGKAKRVAKSHGRNRTKLKKR